LERIAGSRVGMLALDRVTHRRPELLSQSGKAEGERRRLANRTGRKRLGCPRRRLGDQQDGQ
jgi:hypothetical protein